MRLVLSFLLLSFCGHVAYAQHAFLHALENTPRPGTEQLRVAFSDEAGNASHLPIAILKGKEAGPVFTIVAGVHGFEYPPIVATQALLREIDTERLRGTIIVIPIASLEAFYTRTPFTSPEDGVNLNGAFPGDPDGSITQQKAHFITKNIIAATDVFVDIHGGDAPEDLLPFICYYNNPKAPEQTSLAERLCLQSGFQYVVSYPYTITATEPAKYTFKQAVQDGKTALSIECGKLGNVEKEEVDLIKRAVYGMLATLEMYDEAARPHPAVVRRNHQVYVRSGAQGIFYGKFRAGDAVRKGEVIGYTTDEFGKVLEEYEASMTGIVLYNLATPAINVGDTVMCISGLR